MVEEVCWVGEDGGFEVVGDWVVEEGGCEIEGGSVVED